MDIKNEINEDGSIKGYASVRVVELPCIGMLQPAMIDIAIDSGVPGVLAVGCKPGIAVLEPATRGSIKGFS